MGKSGAKIFLHLCGSVPTLGIGPFLCWFGTSIIWSQTMSMYIDYSTLDRIARLFSISKIAKITGINQNTLWSMVHRKTLDSNPAIMLKIGLALAENGIFIKRDNESNIEFAARVQEYCHKKHGEELNVT